MTGKSLLVLLCCISGIICFIAPPIAASILIGTALYIWFNMANPKKKIKEDEENSAEEDIEPGDENFEDPTAKIYREQVEKELKPNFEKDPKWQELSKKVKAQVKENQKKEEQIEKNFWKDESDFKMDKEIKQDNKWWEDYI